MAKKFLLLAIFATLISINSSAMEITQSSKTTPFNENEEFEETFNKLKQTRQEFINTFCKQPELQQKQVAKLIHKNHLAFGTYLNNMDASETIAFEKALKLLGYPGKSLIPEYNDLSQARRSFAEKFATWSDKEQNRAILFGITKNPFTQQTRPEFSEKLPDQEQQALQTVFAAIGYNLKDPTESKNLTYRSLEQIEKSD